MPDTHSPGSPEAGDHSEEEQSEVPLPDGFEAWLHTQSIDTLRDLSEHLLALKVMAPEERKAYLSNLAEESEEAQKRRDIFGNIAIFGERLLKIKSDFDQAIDHLHVSDLHVKDEGKLDSSIDAWMTEWKPWQDMVNSCTTDAEREALPALKELVRSGIVAKVEDEMGRAKETKAVSLRKPDFYYALAARREQEDKEMKKLGTANYNELISFFMTALHEGNESRAGAILRKLANDYNDNEIWNYFGYPSNSLGMHMFFMEVMCGLSVRKNPHDVIPFDAWFDPVKLSGYLKFNAEGQLDIKNATKIGHIPGTNLHALSMPFQMALSLESDVSYINEERWHWETARVVGVNSITGEYFQYSETEHAIECTAELRKAQPREIQRRMNRLGYGGEVPVQIMNPSAGRQFNISLLGIMVNLAIGDPSSDNTISREMNTNAKYWLSRPDIKRQIDRVAPPKVRKYMDLIAKYAPDDDVSDFGILARKGAAAKGAANVYGKAA